MKTRRMLASLAVLVLVLAACGGGGADAGDPTPTSGGSVGPGDIAAGSAVYTTTCIACHGANAEGIEGLGKPLAPNEFVASNSESDIAAFIKVGRKTTDPESVSGIDMPPMGGNPTLTDQDLLNVAAYLKSLN